MIPFRDHNPSRRIPYVTISLIALNLIAFLYQLTYLPEFGVSIYRLGLTPWELTQMQDIAPVPAAVPIPLTLFTSLFLHGGLLHLLSNMLFLWVFGDNVEDAFHHIPFLIFYLGAGVLASLTHVALHWTSTTPLVGASGAIAGVLGAYLVLYPKARVDVLVFLVFFVTVIEIPAFVLLVIWFLLQFVSLGTPGVAWLAHIGGFAVGLGTAAVFLALRRSGGILLKDGDRGVGA